MLPILIPTAEPFFFRGGKVACLLLHGFTASPQEMRGLGEYLHREHGFTVLGVRLAGHATTPNDMRHMHWEDWVASAEDGWHLLRAGGWEDVVVVGLSMGGAIALLLASYLPVSGVVAMATPYTLPVHLPERALWLWSIFKPFIPKTNGEVYDPKGFEGRVSYPVYPVRSVAELAEMLDVMRPALPKVSVPALLIHSRNDRFVPPQNSERIFAALGSADKRLELVERSTHVVTQDAERHRVFRLTADFVEEIAARTGANPP